MILENYLPLNQYNLRLIVVVEVMMYLTLWEHSLQD